MTVKERINSIISVFGVYDVERNIFVRAESEAYWAGLKILVDMFTEMQTECFVVTAVGYGLSKKEELFGSPDEESSTEIRRQRLLSSLSVDETAFTLDGVERFLNSLSDSHTITENPTQNKISVKLANNSRIERDPDKIISLIEAFLPAHLNADVEIVTDM
ncbi:MAG: hypothetical protein IJV39_05780 [Ruminococcus sp.]|nr:hypothetical protein [Ruminococcus sp.]